MDVTRFYERKAELLKAVTRLRDACAQTPDEFMRDSVIQRFEFCWELAWKTLRLWLDYLGVEVANPRDVFREALQNSLIQDGNAWSELQRMRNLTSHTYDEKLAEQVYQFIRASGLPLFEKLAAEVATWQPQSK
ncbi:MAG TPA: nucleotidyltransferase substrate binding protein [Spongiibacteraceae bacterium]|jgi:nucleotidyltransferase substrate binding protein (TIGR01987 family)